VVAEFLEAFLDAIPRGVNRGGIVTEDTGAYEEEAFDYSVHPGIDRVDGKLPTGKPGSEPGEEGLPQVVGALGR
jgi:hypothetical protein